MTEKNFHSQLVETFTLKTLEAMNVMMRVLAFHLFLKMFGHVNVFLIRRDTKSESDCHYFQDLAIGIP